MEDKRVKVLFRILMNCNQNILLLKREFNEIFLNDHSLILNELKELKFDQLKSTEISRVMLFLTKLNQKELVEFKEFLDEEFKHKEYPIEPKKLKDSPSKEDIKAYNDEVKLFLEEKNKIDDWNNKRNSITQILIDNIKTNLYGDKNFDQKNKPYIYFKFFNTHLDDMENFIHEINIIPVLPVKNIKKSEIIDIKNLLPDFLISAHEIRFYFETIEDMDLIKQVFIFVNAVYEKYVIKNSLMKKDGGEWSYFNDRKKSLNPELVTGVMDFDVEDEETDYYSDEFEISLSDCYWNIIEIENVTYFAINPIEFWKEHNTILVNNKMIISEFEDDKKWFKEKDDIYYQYDGDIEEAKEFLEEKSVFLEIME